MIISDVIGSYDIFLSNEEKELVESIDGICTLDSFNEREQCLISSLVGRNILKRRLHNGSYLIKKNEEYYSTIREIDNV